jgi:hypothetical protein
VKFRGLLELNGKTATGVEVPAEVVDGLGSGKSPKVRVTINGYTYRSSVAPMGGRFLLGVSAEVRDNAGVAAGDQVDVDVTLDAEPRTVTVPADLADALDRTDARRTFDALSYSVQRGHVLAVEGAKTAETRQRRVDKVVAEVTGRATGAAR